ncbi:hypothetical protein TWF730_004489 [Orbilia blumenaviensis]|uniref:Wax synthase domain-containing protein n=1 Tax=Orbilia blumenaviensis TaxID=1796055 RepID=A0AAV9TY87_9PEZI
MGLTTLQLACLTTPPLTLTILSLPSSTSTVRQLLYPLPAVLLLQPLLYPPKISWSDKETVQETFALGVLYANYLFAFCRVLYLYGYDTPRYFQKFRRIYEPGGHDDGGGDSVKANSKKQEGYPCDLWGRIKWSLSLLTATRGIGWNFEVSMPQREKYLPTSRWGCVWDTTVLIIQCHLLSNISRFSCGIIVKLLRNEPLPFPTPPILHEIFGNIILQMVIVTVVWAIRAIVFVNLVAAYPRLLFVGLGVDSSWGEPREWPRMFGEVGECWSVRNFWGRAWHQTIRRCIQSPSEKLPNFLLGTDISKLSHAARLLRRYILLFSSFSISGLIHTFGVYFVITGCDNYNPPPNNPPWYYVFYFFIAQAGYITCEDFVYWVLGVDTDGDYDDGNDDGKVGKKRGKVGCVIGMACTMAWFVWCVPTLWADPESRIVGFWEGEGKGLVHVLDREHRF